MSTYNDSNVVYTYTPGSGVASVTGFTSPPTNWTPTILNSFVVGPTTYYVTSIGFLAFQNCTNLVGIDVSLCTSLTNIQGGAFYNCTNLESVNLTPCTSLTSLLEGTFYLCISLVSVTFPTSLNTLGSTFQDCSSLTSADLSVCTSLTSIGYATFYSCISLSSVTFPPSLTRLGGYAFYGCVVLSSVTFPNSLTTVDYYAFQNCSTLTSITFPPSLTTIEVGAFQDCTTLSSVTLPPFLNSIGDYAFSQTIISSITFPTSLTTIGNYAFNICTILSSVDLFPCTSLTSIGNSAFNNCNSLSSVTLPPFLNSIGDYAFGQTIISSVTFPNSLTTIGLGAFQNCSILTSVNLSICNSPTTLGNYAFNNCTSLSSVTLPPFLNSIGDYAFLLCISLSSVTFPNSLTTIGEGAFRNCSTLATVTFYSNPLPSIGTDTFTGIADPSTAYYPYGADLTPISGLFTTYIELPPPPPCFLTGSKILTDQGYRPIEELKTGDRVKTLKHGFLKIVLLGKSSIYNSGKEERIKDRLYRCSKDQYPELTEDLVLTGCHSLIVDCLTQEQGEKTVNMFGLVYYTEDKLRLMTFLDEKAIPYEKEGTFTIYHLALENDNYYTNYGIYANGLLVETCSKRYLKEHSHMELME